jgi:hypothetical protein
LLDSLRANAKYGIAAASIDLRRFTPKPSEVQDERRIMTDVREAI